MHKVFKVILVHKVYREKRAQLVHKVFKENKVLLVLKVYREKRAQLVHKVFMGGIVSQVNSFTKAGQVHVLTLSAEILHHLGLKSSPNVTLAKNKAKKRATLGLHPIGLTAIVAMLFVAVFLYIASS